MPSKDIKAPSRRSLLTVATAAVLPCRCRGRLRLHDPRAEQAGSRAVDDYTGNPGRLPLASIDPRAAHIKR